jgi:hypothetical protein
MKGLRRRGLKDSRRLANRLDCWVADPRDRTSNWWETHLRNATENLGKIRFPTFSQVIAFADFVYSRRDRHDIAGLFRICPAVWQSVSHSVSHSLFPGGSRSSFAPRLKFDDRRARLLFLARVLRVLLDHARRLMARDRSDLAFAAACLCQMARRALA